MDIKEQFRLAKAQIDQSNYNEARKILLKIKHPKAKEWLSKLDSITLATSQAKPKSVQTNIGAKLVIAIVLILIVIAALVIGILFVPKTLDLDTEVFVPATEEPDVPIAGVWNLSALYRNYYLDAVVEFRPDGTFAGGFDADSYSISWSVNSYPIISFRGGITDYVGGIHFEDDQDVMIWTYSEDYRFTMRFERLPIEPTLLNITAPEEAINAINNLFETKRLSGVSGSRPADVTVEDLVSIPSLDEDYHQIWCLQFYPGNGTMDFGYGDFLTPKSAGAYERNGNWYAAYYELWGCSGSASDPVRN